MRRPVAAREEATTLLRGAAPISQIRKANPTVGCGFITVRYGARMSAQESSLDPKQPMMRRLSAWTSEIDWQRVAGAVAVAGVAVGAIALKRWGDKVYAEHEAEQEAAWAREFHWTDKNRWE